MMSWRGFERNVRSEIEYYPSIFQVEQKKILENPVNTSGVPVDSQTELHR
jgi:hypothetical protein